MAISDQLVQNYHSVSLGGIDLLSLDGHDYFPPGSEPSVTHQQAADAPEVSGQTNGLLFPRGNFRWSATVSRVREFYKFDYPITDGAITAAGPEEYAQKWFIRHMGQLKIGSAGMTWGGKTWTKAVISPSGSTDMGFVIMNYQLQMVEAS